jgi:outer membrane receptor protein involved in Fe transport
VGGKLNIHNFSFQVLGYYKKVNNWMIIYASFDDRFIQNRWVQQGYLTSLYDGASRIYGVDFNTQWKPQENTQISLEMNYQNWKLENYEFNFHQPNFRLKFQVQYDLNKKLELFSRISYISSIYLGYLSDNSVINQKGIFLMDLHVGYNLKPNVQAFVGGNNLFNQKYYLLRYYQEIPIHGFAGFRILF